MICKRYVIPFFLAPWLLTGCMEDFNPDVHEEPVAVLNTLVCADSTLWAQVSRSWMLSDPLPDPILSDAEVSYAVNGGAWLPMAYNPERRRYEAGHVAREGDRVEVSADTRYGVVSASASVPRGVVIDSVSSASAVIVDYNSIIAVDDGQFVYGKTLQVYYRVTISDTPGERDYYMVGGNVMMVDPVVDVNDSELDWISSASGFCIFTDRLFDGSSYTLSLQSDHSLTWVYPDRRYVDEIVVCRITADYYRYLASLYKKYGTLRSDLEYYGFMEPVAVFSNVSGGVGIAAGENGVARSFDITKLVIDAVSGL